MLRRSSGRSREVVACENRTGDRFFFFLFQEEIHSHLTWGTKFLQGLYFCRLAIFCVLRELIFPIRTDWFCLELIFAIFRKYPCTQHWLYFRFYRVRAIEIHISSNKPVFSCFWVREANCDCHDRHDFVVLYFCVVNLSWRIFTLEIIFAEKVCPTIFICGNLILWIAGKTAKIAKIRTRKNFLPHGILREEERLLLKISKHGIHSMYFLS